MERKLVYICSPYAGDIERNTKQAKEYCRAAVREGATPIAVHLLYPQILDENNPGEREQGIKMGLDILNVCDEVWVFGDEISSGMSRELERADAMNIPVICREVSQRQGMQMTGMGG